MSSFKIIPIKVDGEGSQWHFCQVNVVFADRGYGFARCGKDSAMFHVGQAMDVEAGRQGPELRSPKQRVGLPPVGTKILVIVEKTHDGHRATAWTRYDDYVAVREAMFDARSRWTPQAPKPASALPKQRPNPFVTGPKFVPTKSENGTVVPFEFVASQQSGVGFLSAAVESSRAHAQG